MILGIVSIHTEPQKRSVFKIILFSGDYPLTPTNPLSKKDLFSFH